MHIVDGWQLTPEGAVIHPGERTAVIADLHLGYEWARGAAGDCVPAHSLHEMLTRLSCVLDRAALAHVVVAGDLVESARACRRTAADVDALRAWLAARGVQLMVLEGNHDRPARMRGGPITSMVSGSASQRTTTDIAGWTVGHGDRPIKGFRIISAHHHPVLRFEGNTAPCFLLGPGRIILPAFSLNAAGCDVVTARLPRDFRMSSLRCVVSTGQELLDFGPLANLRRRLRGTAN